MHIVKIVGNANSQTWSQVHSFSPQDERLISHGELIAALAFKAKNPEIEVTAFGTEIINRLQEIYYSNEAEGIFKKLSQTLESLGAEFLDKIELEVVAGVVWRSKDKTFLYTARNSEGQVWLKRQERILKLFGEKKESIEVLSGELKEGDRLILGSQEFFRIVAEGEIRTALTGNLESGGEILGAKIHGGENNSRAAGALVEVEPPFAKASEGQESSKKERATKVIKVGKAWRWLREKWENKRPRINLREVSRGKKSTLSALAILLLVFGISLALAGRKKQTDVNQKNYQALLEEVKYKYDEAHGLLKLNPLRAKSLLTDSQTRIQEYKDKSKKELTGELKDLAGKIEEDLGQVQREYQIDSATEWFDFNLVKDGFKGSAWAGEDKTIWVWDGQGKTAAAVDLGSRASRVVAGADKGIEGNIIAFTDDRGMVVSSNKISIIDNKSGITAMAGEGWQNIVEARGFGGNLYLLDKSKTGQIWKYLGVASGLSAKRAYLKGTNLDLSEAVSMTIDGSVWVLFSDGTIVKYTQGVKDAFTVAGLDKNFGEPSKIYTTAEDKNLYILDRKQTRVVVLVKTGEYQAQYIWPGLAGAKDLIVNESLGKMFFLTGQKVFTIDLRN
ncbi:MAG: hypothetical protein NTZ93_04365 [Candidatus Beckwithbacteria bacterium]|nr:hypothetical protein [Candidatus Beckwithbacteria bacterium]